jgi:glyoxylase-like metal-dependent hydrolase (beta-lactamase superfamily II)
MSMHRPRTQGSLPVLWALLVGLGAAAAGPALAQTGPAAAAAAGPDLEGSASLLQPELTQPLERSAPLVGVGDLTAGRQATWLLPAEYGRTINGIDVLQVRPDIYMLSVNGQNVAVESGWQGTLVIDTGDSQQCDALMAAIAAISQSPIRYIINTSTDADRRGCNRSLAEAGRAFTSGVLGFAAPVIATQDALLQMIGSGQNYAADELPSEIFTRPVRNMYLNDQAVQVFAMPKAHTSGDTMVLFRRSDVVVAGNVLDETAFPVIDLKNGGSIDGEIAALNRLLDEFTVAVSPKWQRPGGTVVIPGRGPLCVQTDVLNYRDMVTIVRDRVKALVDRGQSLEQVQKSDPARGYTTRYGKAPGSSETFVASIYQSLQAGRRGAKQ